jgi:hypothetical protein
MCDAFDIKNEKTNHCGLNVLQNNLVKFDYGRFRVLELHLDYDLGKIPHVVFLHVIINLVFATSKHQQ